MKTKPGFVVSKELAALQAQGIPNDQPPPAAALNDVFAKIGGVQRMAMWADHNPTTFYKLYARMVIPTIPPEMLPQPAAQTIEAWPDWLTSRRLAYQVQHDPTQADTDDA